MNKKIKYISTLATTGIMALTSLAGTVNAATSLGAYRNLVKGIDSDKVVPYVLKDRSDRLTIADIAKQYNIASFNGIKGYSESTVVKTGDTFVADKETYEVIVYGDIASKDGKTVADGKVDSKDANLMLKLAVAKDKSQLVDNVNLEAADIVNDGKINSADANLALKFAVGKGSIDVTLTPEPEAEYDYTMAAKSNYINNVNEGSVELTVTPKTSFVNEKTLTIQVLDAEKKEVAKVTSSSLKCDANKKTDKITVNFSQMEGVKEGEKVTLQLMDGEKVVGELKLEVRKTAPSAIKVSTKRVDTKNIEMSLENMNADTLTKINYTVATTKDSTPDEADLTSSKTITGNKLTNVNIKNDASEGQVYYVYYALENAYGSKSAVTGPITVATSATVAAKAEIEKVTEPDLTKNAEFTCTLKATAPAKVNYVAYLYDANGKVIAVQEPADETTVTDNAFTMDFADEIENAGAGKYSVGVVIKGEADGSKTDSAEVKSKAVEVKQLKEPTEVAITVDKDGNKMVTWKDANAATEISGYTVTVADAEGNDVTVETPATGKEKETQRKITETITPNVVYSATVKVNAVAGQKAIVSSKAIESNGFFVIEPNTQKVATDVTEDSVSIAVTKDIEINKKKATYQVEIHGYETITDSQGKETTISKYEKTVDVALKDGKLKVEGLKPNTRYAFKVIANVDGIKGESEYITKVTGDKDIVTLSKAPAIENLTKVAYDASKEQANNTVAINGTDVIIKVNNQKYTVKADSNYSADFMGKVELLKTINTGDVITIKGTDIAITLSSNQDLDLSSVSLDLTKMTVAVTGNQTERTITVDDKELKALVLQGNSLFTISVAEDNAVKVTVKDTVEVKGNGDYTVAANANVIVNGIGVKAAKELDVTTSAEKSLVVNTKTGANDNTLVFTNVNNDRYSEENATINFKEKDTTTTVTGTISITSTKGKVTVTGDTNSTGVKLDVIVTDADVDVKGFETKETTVNVTASKDATVTIDANATMEAPMTMDGKEIKGYTDAQIIETFFAGDETTKAEDIKAVKDFMNSFGAISGKGATIKTTEGSKTVKITVPEGVSGVNITGIK